jgi:hypothetical protein
MFNTRFYNKERNKNTLNSLSNALASRSQTNINTGSVTPSYIGSNKQEEDNTLQGAVQLGRGIANLYNQGKENGWFNFGGADTGNHLASGASDFSLGSAENLSFGDTGASSGGGFSGGSVPWAAIGKTAKTGYNWISDKDDADYSDLEQSTIYPLQGASMGASFGPWGALGGALYGLGYSFKDDIGLGDNELLTDLIFPIGMGDEHEGLIQL